MLHGSSDGRAIGVIMDVSSSPAWLSASSASHTTGIAAWAAAAAAAAASVAMSFPHAGPAVVRGTCNGVALHCGRFRGLTKGTALREQLGGVPMRVNMVKVGELRASTPL